MILDEAQRIKNWNTIAARALKRIDSPYAIVLTGTPLENRLEELISIVQFVDQHRLGPTWRLLHEHQVTDEAGRVIGYRDLDQIGQTLAPVLIRRRKAEVLRQLPEPDRPEPVRADDRAAAACTTRRTPRSSRRIVAALAQDRVPVGHGPAPPDCALQNMRMSCNSTYLLDQETDHGVKADELATLLDELFDDPGAKVVVFSQWCGTHDIVIRRLEARAAGLRLLPRRRAVARSGRR